MGITGEDLDKDVTFRIRKKFLKLAKIRATQEGITLKSFLEALIEAHCQPEKYKPSRRQ